jgi:hypothetical protein
MVFTYCSTREVHTLPCVLLFVCCCALEVGNKKDTHSSDAILSIKRLINRCQGKLKK